MTVPKIKAAAKFNPAHAKSSFQKMREESMARRRRFESIDHDANGNSSLTLARFQLGDELPPTARQKARSANRVAVCRRQFSHVLCGFDWLCYRCAGAIG